MANPAPVIIVPQAADPPRKTNWIPSRKAVSAGIGGIIASTIAAVSLRYGYPIPAELLPPMAAGIMWLIYFLVPASKADIVRNLDNEIVAIAINDPTSPVSAPGIVHEVIKQGDAAAITKAPDPPPPELPLSDVRL